MLQGADATTRWRFDSSMMRSTSSTGGCSRISRKVNRKGGLTLKFFPGSRTQMKMPDRSQSLPSCPSRLSDHELRQNLAQMQLELFFKSLGDAVKYPRRDLRGYPGQIRQYMGAMDILGVLLFSINCAPHEDGFVGLRTAMEPKWRWRKSSANLSPLKIPVISANTQRCELLCSAYLLQLQRTVIGL